MAILSERDAREWQALADQVSFAVEARLSRSVLANRTHSDPAGVRPAPLGPALRTARRKATILVERSPVLIRTDVRSFYPSMTPAVLFMTLRDMGFERQVARQAAGMLDGWGSEGYAGLPIGPPGSAVLANAVLAQVDTSLEPGPFLRWVDDYLIGVADERLVPQVLETLDTALARRRLERSIAKTSILGGGSALVWPGTYGRT